MKHTHDRPDAQAIDPGATPGLRPLDTREATTVQGGFGVVNTVFSSKVGAVDPDGEPAMPRLTDLKLELQPWLGETGLKEGFGGFTFGS